MKLGEVIQLISSPASASPLLDTEPLGYAIDSRTVRPAELFFAIKGEHHDGHDFVADALNRGALAAVVSRDFAASSAAQTLSPNLIAVDDPITALQKLAAALLSRWPGREIAITGSMGKTTTKEMTAAALAYGGRVMKTTGNFNNEIGLPLSILKMESDGARAADFDFAVLEMGMNHAGELTRLTRIAPPDFAVVTNVAPVHLEFFRSVEEIADAKAELIEGVKSGGAAALNVDDPLVAGMCNRRTDIDFRTFGIDCPASVRASHINLVGIEQTQFTLETQSGNVEVTLPTAGRHNLYNALAAATAADYYHIPLPQIALALSDFVSPKMRGHIYRFQPGFRLIDDSYNSNPRALIEMARTLATDAEAQRRIVVAGEMLELGESGAELHQQTGREIAALGIDVLIGVRGLAKYLVAGALEAGMQSAEAVFCETPEAAANVLQSTAQAGDLILVKGSRGVKTEIVVEKIKAEFNLFG